MICACTPILSLLAGSIAITMSNIAMAELTAPVQVRTHEECPEGLTVTAKPLDGMIEFVIRVDSDKIEQNDLYEGRINATCHLDLALGQERVAYTQLQATPEKTFTVFRLRISATATRSSHLHINTHLYEADGLPTIGGGKTLQIHLAGFVPAKQEPGRE